MLSVRPKVAELVFQLYGRALHPELFEVYRERIVRRGDFEAKVQITSAGHLVTWMYGGMVLTEVATGAQHPLPIKRRLMSCSLEGERFERIECRGGVSYEVDFALERVDPEVFWTYQRELCASESHQGLFYKFDSSGRMAMGAMSYINCETRSKSLLVQAFHTFPDDCAIVKSQSTFSIA